jgi:hypothetical protein
LPSLPIYGFITGEKTGRMIEPRPHYLLSLFILIVFWSCQSKPAPFREEPCKTLEPKDSADYTHLKSQFYRGKDGKLYERKLAVDKLENDTSYCYFASYDPYLNGYDSLPTLLDSVIDIDSYTDCDSSSYSKDKKHVYYYFSNTDGGIRYVLEDASPTRFVSLHDYRWGTDGEHLYCGGGKVKGINMKKYQALLFPDKEDVFLDYVKDDRHVFYETDSIPGADPASFQTSVWEKGKEWDAYDRNYKYYAGKRVDSIVKAPGSVAGSSHSSGI